MAAKAQPNQSPKPTLDSLFPRDWSTESEDSDFPSDTEPDYSGSFSDEGSTFSGDEEIAAKGREWLRKAEERKAGKAHTAKTPSDNEDPVLADDDDSSDEGNNSLPVEERCICSLCTLFPLFN